jgi:hypothetical protein
MPKPVDIASERRAPAARLSLCFLMVVFALAGAAGAQAAPPPMVMVTGTTPPSSPDAPAESTEPLVFGEEEEGIIISRVDPIRAGIPPIRASSNLANEVSIFSDAACTELLATGTLAEFRGSGIRVLVPEDAATTLFATQVDSLEPGEPSTCPVAGYTYYEGTIEEEPEKPGGGEGPGAGETPATGSSAPPPAPHIFVEPGERANDSSPLVAGNAPGAGSVKVFAAAGCSGAAVAKGSPAELTAGIVVGVSENATTIFSAAATSGGTQSHCSNAVAYTEDSAPPHTRFTMAPGAKTRRHKVTVRFADTSGDPFGASFKCKLDGHKWRSCHSPVRLKHLGYRRHVLRVRGIDSLGNVELKPAKRRFKVVH